MGTKMCQKTPKELMLFLSNVTILKSYYLWLSRINNFHSERLYNSWLSRPQKGLYNLSEQ